MSITHCFLDIFYAYTYLEFSPTDKDIVFSVLQVFFFAAINEFFFLILAGVLFFSL
jgi:hypothetical protein